MRDPTDGPDADHPAPALDLSFTASVAGTRARRRCVRYPYTIQAPLRGSGRQPPCRLIVQSASGGLFGGESWRQRLVAEADSRAILTFPTATTVHAMRDGGEARVRVELVARERATLIYRARPLILFPTSRVVQDFRLKAEETATILLCDAFMSHDPWAGGAPFGRLATAIELCRPGGHLTALDRMAVDGALLQAGLPGLSHGFEAFGTLFLARHMDGETARAWLEKLARLAEQTAGLHVAGSPLRQQAGLVLRLAGRDGGALDAGMTALFDRLQSDLA